MARSLDQDLFYSSPDVRHFNICLVGGGVQTRLIARAFAILRPEQIEWVWIVEEKRRASADEIQLLCKAGRHQRPEEV
jgi:hypothetical protein